LIDKTIANRGNETALNEVRAAIKELTAKYPLYPELS